MWVKRTRGALEPHLLLTSYYFYSLISTLLPLPRRPVRPRYLLPTTFYLVISTHYFLLTTLAAQAGPAALLTTYCLLLTNFYSLIPTLLPLPRRPVRPRGLSGFPSSLISIGASYVLSWPT